MLLLLRFSPELEGVLLGFSLQPEGVPLSLDQELLDADDETCEA
jgi:hypothetical protein